MLRAARHLHAEDRHEEPVPGRRRGAELRGQRADPPRRALREHLDPAGGRRCRRGPGHGAVHLASTAGQPAASPRPATRKQGSLLGPQFSDDEIRAFLDAERGPLPLLAERGRTVRPRGRPGGRGKGRRLGARADGVRPAGLGRPQHPGRRPQPAHAGGDEPEDQVPRVVPPLCPGGACRSGPASFSRCAADQESPYMLLVAPVAAGQRLAADGAAAARTWTSSKLVRARAGHDARRLLGPRADRGRRAAPRLLQAAARRSRRRPAAR